MLINCRSLIQVAAHLHQRQKGPLPLGSWGMGSLWFFWAGITASTVGAARGSRRALRSYVRSKTAVVGGNQGSASGYRTATPLPVGPRAAGQGAGDAGRVIQAEGMLLGGEAAPDAPRGPSVPAGETARVHRVPLSARSFNRKLQCNCIVLCSQLRFYGMRL